MNVLGTHIIDCLSRLEAIGGGLESVCLFLKRFVDWNVDIRSMLEGVYMKMFADVPMIDESARKHVEVIYLKLEELLDGVTDVLTSKDKDLYELVAKGNAL
jgi:hypothetical protein